MPRNSKATYSFHPTTPTIFEKKNGFSSSSIAPVAPAAPAAPASAVAPASGPSFGQTLKEGFAFGAGSSIARTIIESAISRMGPAEPVRVSSAITSQDIKTCNERALSNKCVSLEDSTRQAWVQCMKETKFDDSKCDTLF